MPLSETAQKLLASLRKQKIAAAQRHYAELVEEAKRKASGTNNGAALVSFLLKAHATSMLEFGSAILSSYREAFEDDRSCPTDADSQEIVREFTRTVGLREEIAVDEFRRLQAATGAVAAQAAFGIALQRDRNSALQALRDEFDVWRHRRELQLQATAAASQNLSITGNNNQVVVAARDVVSAAQMSTYVGPTETESDAALGVAVIRLLRAALKDKGQMMVIDTQQAKYVSAAAGMENFVSDDDPAFEGLHLDALEFLVKSGLARHDSGQLYVLTGAGFAKAKALAPKEDS